MPPFPTRKDDPSNQSQLGGNNDDNDYDDELHDEADGCASLTRGHKMVDRKKVMMVGDVHSASS